jgi:ornithine decarboxylase
MVSVLTNSFNQSFNFSETFIETTSQSNQYCKEHGGTQQSNGLFTMTTAPTTDKYFNELTQRSDSVKNVLHTRLAENGQLRNHAMPLMTGPESADIGFDSEEPFYVCDLGEVVKQYVKFKTLLPRVEPFYAIKCHPDVRVIETLVSMGAGFDCASRGEIELVMKCGVKPESVIYANPCKAPSQIRFAQSVGVCAMTFDNADELIKIKRLHPAAQLVLRILADDSKSACRFGVKFGASLSVAENLLKMAKELDLNVVGVSFHVGSGCFDASAFADAVSSARLVFDMAAQIGFKFNLLDLGGGFPGSGVGVGSSASGITFEEIASVLRDALAKDFPTDDVRIIAEPGRYFVSSAYTLACNITSRRVVPRKPTATLKPPLLKLRPETPDTESVSDDATCVLSKEKTDGRPGFMYYINDGVYGSMNCIIFDHVTPSPMTLTSGGTFLYDTALNEPVFPCSLWGPTCDSMDCIKEEVEMPELDVGDWLYFQDVGAYTRAAASEFNGFKRGGVEYTHTEVDLFKIVVGC